MIDEHNLLTRLEYAIGSFSLDNYAISKVLSLLPAGVSSATDITCPEIRNNPAAAQFLRIPACLSRSSPADNSIPFQAICQGNQIFFNAMPLQRAVWHGESTWEEGLDYLWKDGTCLRSWRNSPPPNGNEGNINGAAGVCEDITNPKKVHYRAKAHAQKNEKITAYHNEPLSLACQEVKAEMTRHSQTQRHLRSAKDAMAKVFQYSPDSISISTLEEGRYVHVNHAYTVLSGYASDELIGYTGIELAVWAYPEERDVLLQYIQTQGQITNYEMHFRTKSGQILICLVSGGIIEINGETHLICVIKDITQRKSLEEKLSISEERFSKAFNFSPYPMCISTIKEGRFIEVNQSFCRASGYTSAELLGRSVLELGLWLNPDDRRFARDMVMKNGSVRDFEVAFRTRSGEHRELVYNAERIEVQNIPCLFTVIMDITEKKHVEAEMLRLDRLNIVGEMATSIGHEIRNPMTTVRGYLQLLAQNERYRPEMECFDIMIEELDRANLIITEFLALAKNKMVELKPTNINSIIDQLLPFIRAQASLRNQRIKTELEHLPKLLVDGKEIRQLMLNLIQNGMESMPSGGKITIKTNVEKETLVLMVKDEGNGIKPQDIAKLGTPFFTTKENGTGLGLAVCYRIAAHHNAKIEFETACNGTTFYIKFPLQRT